MFSRLTRGRKRKTFGALGATLVALSIVGAALAYYGGSGTGSASASAGHAPRAVTVTGSAVDVLYPGASSNVDLEVALTGNGNAHVGAISLNTALGDNGISGLPVGCLRSWFTFTGPGSGMFPNGANVSEGSPLTGLQGSLTFEESGTNQDACSDASLTLNLTASPS